MNWKWLITIAAVLAVVFFLIWVAFEFRLLQKPAISLVVSGKNVAVVRQSFIGPIRKDSSADVYVGNKKIFSLCEDDFDGPMFIYPFADGKRFLCDYDYDVAMLDFVVDLNVPGTNGPSPATWPLNEQLRADLERMATNVVFDTTGVVRLPNYAELEEVSSYLNGSNPVPVKAAYFDLFNHFLNQWDKEALLINLAINRSSQ